MSAQLGLGYAALGAVCVAWAWRRRAVVEADALDLALLGLIWPLYGPILLLRRTAAGPPRAGLEVAHLLPPGVDADALGAQLSRARQRARDIDAVLAHPDFDRARVEAHRDHLAAAGQERAAARVDARLDNIARLDALRARCAGELAEIEELVVQLRLQAAVVHLTDGAAERRRVVDALLARMEGLDALLDEGLWEPG